MQKYTKFSLLICNRGFISRRNIFGFSPTKRHVSILYHVPNLPLHCYYKQNDEVEQQYRPKYGNIKKLEKGHCSSHHHCSCAWIPKFKFWKSASKRSSVCTLIYNYKFTNAVSINYEGNLNSSFSRVGKPTSISVSSGSTLQIQK